MRLFRRHILDRLAAQIDGECRAGEAQRLERHLAECERCRSARQEVESGMAVLDRLPMAEAPETIWRAIETALSGPAPARPAAGRPRLAWSVLGAAILAVAVYWSVAQRPAVRWAVVRIQGGHSGTGSVGAGEWIDTDSMSRAVVSVGTIGTVEVAPDTRVRVVAVRPGEHRLALARGEIHAKISAPPRLFFVETTAGTAVDLGCEYSLHTDEDGTGLLQVTRGWVSFQWKELESLVPSGASCRTEPGAGPGVPWFDDAPAGLKQALERFGLEKSANDPLQTVLDEARVRDTLTLWHLLWRVGPDDRERVYNRMAALTPVPAGISREMALKLDRPTLARWKDELAWTW